MKYIVTYYAQLQWSLFSDEDHNAESRIRVQRRADDSRPDSSADSDVCQQAHRLGRVFLSDYRDAGLLQLPLCNQRYLYIIHIFVFYPLGQVFVLHFVFILKKKLPSLLSLYFARLYGLRASAWIQYHKQGKVEFFWQILYLNKMMKTIQVDLKR